MAIANSSVLSIDNRDKRGQLASRARDGSKGINSTERQAIKPVVEEPRKVKSHAHMYASKSLSTNQSKEKIFGLEMFAGQFFLSGGQNYDQVGSRSNSFNVPSSTISHFQVNGQKQSSQNKNKSQFSPYQPSGGLKVEPYSALTQKTASISGNKFGSSEYQRSVSSYQLSPSKIPVYGQTSLNDANKPLGKANPSSSTKPNEIVSSDSKSLNKGNAYQGGFKSSPEKESVKLGFEPKSRKDDKDHELNHGREVEVPKNMIIFIRDQVKPEDLWLPRDWAKNNLPNQQWLKDNGLSFSNACTNSAMCTAARSTFFTSKFPAQHEVKLVLSDIQNPILNVQPQLSPDLPNLATLLKGQGYDVGFIGKAHLSKTFTRQDGETVYQDLASYGFDDWQGPDAGQDMEVQNAGGGFANNDGKYTSQAVDWITNRASSGSSKPFCLVVSLINPHDVLSYPLTYKDFGYDESWLQGDIKDLPPTVNEILFKNYKPTVQSQWNLAQQAAQPLFTDQEKLNYLNFYGNLMIDVDRKMGEVLTALGKTDNPSTYSQLLKDTMIVSTADHGEMGLSHGGLVQKMEVAYDEALKVPMVWSNPEFFEGGQETDALVSHVDFLPTLANFLGFDPEYIKKQDFRGVDYSKILNYAESHESMKGAPEVQDTLLYTYDDIYAGQDPSLAANVEHGLFPAANRIHALRSKDFKLVRYYSGDKAYVPANWEEEFYDLRKTGGDYYPDRDPVTGQLNTFKAAPLELINLAPKADIQRTLEGKQAVATPYQIDAYKRMSLLLDQQIAERLSPMPSQPAVKPSVFVYQGGSLDGSVYKDGDKVSRLIQGQGTQTLELAFNTRANQDYNIVYKGIDGNPVTLLSGITGTNGPVYEYLSGLPTGIGLADIGIQWSQGIVPLA